jgi:hypothetical protein
MHMLRIVSLSLASWFIAAPIARPADPTTENPLVGTWKCVSAKYGGNEVARPAGFTQIKHVTPAQFIWAVHDGEGKVSTVLGGSYTLKGDAYVETPEYGTAENLEQLKGKPQSFTWKVEGDKWHHTGKLSTGLTIEEVWERVKPK